MMLRTTGSEYPLEWRKRRMGLLKMNLTDCAEWDMGVETYSFMVQ